MKKHAFTVVILILAGLFAAFFLKPSNPTTEPIEISSEQLWAEFASNKEAAMDRFNGRLLAVSGTVAEVSEAFMGKPCVLLENGVNSIPNGIFCTFPEKSLSSVIALTIGAEATITGTCTLSLHLSGADVPYIFIEDAQLQ